MLKGLSCCARVGRLASRLLSFVGRVGYLELCSLFCTDICGKTSRFSLEFANVSMNFAALFAHHTRPAPPQNAQKSQACVTHCVTHI